jgi:hypothetical protein
MTKSRSCEAGSIWIVHVGKWAVKAKPARVAAFGKNQGHPKVYIRRTSVPASKSCSPCLRSVNPTMM